MPPPPPLPSWGVQCPQRSGGVGAATGGTLAAVSIVAAAAISANEPPCGLPQSLAKHNGTIPHYRNIYYIEKRDTSGGTGETGGERAENDEAKQGNNVKKK